MLNLDDKNQKTINANIINNQGNNDELYKLKSNELARNCKNSFKLAINKVKKHKYRKSLQNSLIMVYKKNKQKSSSFPLKSSINTMKSTETSVNISVDDKNVRTNEANLNNVTDINKTGFNNVTGGNVNNTNETVLNNTVDENKTVLNQTGNGTIANETNINGTSLNNTDENKTVSNQSDNSTKAHLLNTIENAGYAFAAIAACFAVGATVAPEGVIKTVCVVGAIVCGVAAAVCFVTHILVDWFW